MSVFRDSDRPWGLKSRLTVVSLGIFLDFSAPSVADFAMNSGMTGLTYSFQVAYVVSSALRERFYVVDSFCRCISSFGKADLAERMLCGISLSDERPCLSVAFSCRWISLIFLVASCLFLCMLFAEPSFSEFRASGVRTRTFRFLWHCLLQIKKLQGVNLRAWFCS